MDTDIDIFKPSSFFSYFKEQKKLEEIVVKISSSLKGYWLVSIPIVVNAMSISLIKKPQNMDNHNLLIVPKGYGKTTLLSKILAESNPRWYIELPSRIFEPQILDFSDEYFDRKIWVLDDLITTFSGMNKKQRYQLIGFFNDFLSKGHYGRKDKIKEGRILCQFGLASENYREYCKEMFSSTFEDRMTPIKFSFTIDQIKRILSEQSYDNELPKVKLPFKKSMQNVEIPQEFDKDINNIALDFQTKAGFSAIRAKTYIKNFIKSNAVLNERKVCKEDLRLFRFIFPLHFDIGPLTLEDRILRIISSKERVIGSDIKKQFENSCSVRSIQDALSIIRKEEKVNFKKISLPRGYDYEYWV